MSRTFLTLDVDLDFRVLGISSHQKDYRLSWFLNKALGLKLEKTEDVVMDEGAGEDRFSCYQYLDPLTDTHYTLFGNMGENSYFLNEFRQADYFLKLEGDWIERTFDATLNKIKEIDVVIMAFDIDVSKIKNSSKLILE